MKTLTLKQPITTTGGHKISEINLSVPTVGDIIAAKRRATNPFEEDMYTIASIAKLTPEDIVNMSYPDFLASQQILMGMLESPLPVTTPTSLAK